MKTPTYSVVIHRTDGTQSRVKMLDAKMALSFVDAMWRNETPDDKLELLVIWRNRTAYLGCPRPEGL